MTITVNGTDLDDPWGRWWVSDRTEEAAAAALSLTTVTTPGMLGEYDAPSAGYGPIVWPLVMRVTGADRAETLANKAALDAVMLDRHADLEVVDGNKVAWGKCAAGTEVERFAYGKRMDVAYPIRIPKGRWFDTTETTVTLGAGNRTSGTQADGTYLLTALLGGSRDMDPTIETVGIGSTTDYRVTDVASGAWVRIAGNITAGQVISINPADLTATAAGAPVSGLLDFSAKPFHLSRQATVRVQQNGVQSVTIKARRAWA